MSQETRQIVNSVAGYGLLAIGVFIMFLSFFQVYRVFTKQASIPEFFHFQGVKMDLSKLAPQIDTSGFDALTKQLGVAGNISMQTPQPNETEIIPADMLNSSANIAVFAVLMGFVVNFGAKLATIGVELVRVVTMKPPNPV